MRGNGLCDNQRTCMFSSGMKPHSTELHATNRTSALSMLSVSIMDISKSDGTWAWDSPGRVTLLNLKKTLSCSSARLVLPRTWKSSMAKRLKAGRSQCSPKTGPPADSSKTWKQTENDSRTQSQQCVIETGCCIGPAKCNFDSIFSTVCLLKRTRPVAKAKDMISWYDICIWQGSLEVKLPTIWTDEKQRWEETERRED